MYTPKMQKYIEVWTLHMNLVEAVQEFNDSTVRAASFAGKLQLARLEHEIACEFRDEAVYLDAVEKIPRLKKQIRIQQKRTRTARSKMVDLRTRKQAALEEFYLIPLQQEDREAYTFGDDSSTQEFSGPRPKRKGWFFPRPSFHGDL